MRRWLMILPALMSAGCAGRCVAPSPLGTALTAPVVIPFMILNPRSYHGKDGYSHWNAIPYLGVQKLKEIDRFERNYIVEKYKVAPDFELHRERWGMYDKVTFRQVNGRKRLFYFDTFPSEVPSGTEPARPGT